jgi:hypothetical protein
MPQNCEGKIPMAVPDLSEESASSVFMVFFSEDSNLHKHLHKISEDSNIFVFL